MCPNQGCFDELMEIREHVLEYLKTLREVTHHTNPDESDEIETAKLIETKDKIAVDMIQAEVDMINKMPW